MTLEERVEKLEARVAELEDERAIRELLSRYGFNADCGRNAEYIDLYTEDGVISLSTGGDAIVNFEGKSEISRFINNPKGHSEPGYWRESMHMQGNNVVVHIDGDEAQVNSYSVVLVKGGGNHSSVPAFYTAGNNQWALRKVDGHWLIKERRRRNLGDQYYAENLDATPS